MPPWASRLTSLSKAVGCGEGPDAPFGRIEQASSSQLASLKGQAPGPTTEGMSQRHGCWLPLRREILQTLPTMASERSFQNINPWLPMASSTLSKPTPHSSTVSQPWQYWPHGLDNCLLGVVGLSWALWVSSSTPSLHSQMPVAASTTKNVCRHC